MLYTRAFIQMAIANFFMVSSFGAFFLFPLFVTHHGGSKDDIGIVMGIFTLASVLSRPWISGMVDRFGRKRSYAIGCFILTTSPLFYLLFHGPLPEFYLPLLLVRIIHGIGLAIGFTAVFTYIADIIPEERLTEGISKFGITGLLGFAVGPVIGETVIQQFGFPPYFLTVSAMAVVGFLLQFPLPESYSYVSQESAPSFLSVLRRRKILIVAVVSVLFGFGLAASGSFVAPFAREQGISFVSLYFLCYALTATLTRVFGGHLADRYGEERIIPYNLLVTGIGLFTVMTLGGYPILVTAGILMGFGHGFLFPSLNSLAIRNEPPHIRGKITGAFTGGIDGGVLSGSIFLGYIGEWGGYRILFLSAGLALIMGLGIFRLMTRGR